MSAIVVRELQRSYGDIRAVKGISFEVDHGEVFALVGPSGAGKTTTVEILGGNRERCGGEVSVLGFDPATGGRAYRERIGVVLQEAGLDEESTVRELLRLHAGFYADPRPIDEVLELVGLVERCDARVTALSRDKRRRVDLALGLVGDPEVLFLDDPTIGFDPAARWQAWKVMNKLCATGKTIVLTTQSLEEARELSADRVGVIASGRLVAVGSPAELATSHRNGSLGTIRFRLPDGIGAGNLPDLGGQLLICPSGGIELRTPWPTRTWQVLTTWAQHYRVELEGLTLVPPSFEDIYFELIGRVAAPSTG